MPTKRKPIAKKKSTASRRPKGVSDWLKKVFTPSKHAAKPKAKPRATLDPLDIAHSVYKDKLTSRDAIRKEWPGLTLSESGKIVQEAWRIDLWTKSYDHITKLHDLTGFITLLLLANKKAFARNR